MYACTGRSCAPALPRFPVSIMTSPLERVGLVDLLDSDPRPTFVLLPAGTQSPRPFDIIYQNPALVADLPLVGDIRNAADLAADFDSVHAPFWKWAAASSAEFGSQLDDQRSFPCFGTSWTKIVLQRKWIILNANDTPLPRKSRPPIRRNPGDIRDLTPEPTPLEFPAPLSSETEIHLDVFQAEHESVLMAPDFGPNPQPFLDVIQSVDWDSHSLGPIDEWPAQLQQAFNLVIPDTRAMAIYWGPQYTAIYNEAFSKFCGAHHPKLLGSPVADVWPYLKERLDRFMGSEACEQSKVQDESCFFVDEPDGTVVETFVKWSLTPIFDGGKCVGVQHSLMETTSMRLWERRMKMLLDLGDTLVTARDVKSYWRKTIEELDRWSFSYDVPLAFVYSVGQVRPGDSSWTKNQEARICRLEGALGVPEDHPLAPTTVELLHSHDGLASRFREAMKMSNPLLLQTKDGSLPEELLDGLRWRGYREPCQSAVICPIRPATEETVMGVLFLALNPRRPYDNDYRQFITLLSQKLTSSLTSTVLLEEEARFGRNAVAKAANDQAKLQQKLAYQTEQANKSIQNFQAIAEFIPVGMSFGDPQGNVTFANDAWYRITGNPKGPNETRTMLDCAMEEDRPKIVRAYEKCRTLDVVTFEFRVPCKERHSHMTPGSLAYPMDKSVRHVLALAKAERATDGSVVRLLTCLTDVTIQKEAAEEAVTRAQEAENLKRLAEFATVGMFDMSTDGRLLSANNLFWDLSGLPKVDLTKNVVEPWQSCVEEEDLPVLQKCLENLLVKGRSQSAEIRLKASWMIEDGSGNMIVAPRWVLATFMPVKSSEGMIQSFTGCLSDFSLQKWQLEQEKLRKEEAIESRRQQENFIDMTSHEMRNPLSAILHCTDAIIASLSRVQEIVEDWTPATPLPAKISAQDQQSLGASASRKEEQQLLEDCIESAETIVTCAQHQKRIVDDILTMSKLDSKLLAVTPCTVNPVQIMKDALKMFEVEARRVDIVLDSVVDKSFTDLRYEFLDLDPSRVKQVLINLLTNALKFTKSGDTRNVTVYLKGSKAPPGPELSAVQFIQRFSDAADEYEEPTLAGRTSPVYLTFEVKDTGQGLTKLEMSNLFNRFVQASAKTHVKYGGSGLGLFISRRLTELQSGAIGVASMAGVGSTFAFYIEAYIPSESARQAAQAEARAARLVETKMSESDTGTKARVARTAARKMTTATLGSPGWLSQGEDHDMLDGILVVEDNLINQRITQRGLIECGYSVDVANHGEEALEKLEKYRPRTAAAAGITSAGGQAKPGPGSQPMPINLVLMDVEMPVLDGLSCTRRIRELEEAGAVFCASGGRIPIIAVTANARSEQIKEAKEAGCDDVMVKPYRIPELIEKMEVAIHRLRGDFADSPMA